MGTGARRQACVQPPGWREIYETLADGVTAGAAALGLERHARAVATARTKRQLPFSEATLRQLPFSPGLTARCPARHSRSPRCDWPKCSTDARTRPSADRSPDGSREVRGIQLAMVAASPAVLSNHTWGVMDGPLPRSPPADRRVPRFGRPAPLAGQRNASVSLPERRLPT